MSRDAQRYRRTYSYYRVQPRTEQLEIIVDESLDWKNSVRTASTGNHPLSGASTTLTIGGVTVVDEDRVLLKNQSTASQNGIYYFEVTGGNYVLTRASDARAGTLTSGAATFVEEGTNAGKLYFLTTTNPITVDSTSLTWTEFASGGGGGSTPQYWEEWFLNAIYTTGSIVGIGGTTHYIEQSGNDMKFYDVSNPSGYTLTQLAAMGGGGDTFWSSTTNGSIYTTGSVAIRGGLGSVDAPADIGTNVFFHVSGTFSSSIANSKIASIGGDLHVSGNMKMEAQNQDKEVEIFINNNAALAYPSLNASSLVFGYHNQSSQNAYDAKIKVDMQSNYNGYPRAKLGIYTYGLDGQAERLRVRSDASDFTLISVGPEDTGNNSTTFASRKDRGSSTQNFWAFGAANLQLDFGLTRYPTGIVFRHYGDNPFGAGIASNPKSTSTYGAGLRFWTSTTASDMRGVIDIGTSGDLIMGSGDASGLASPVGVIRSTEQSSGFSQSSMILRIRGANAAGGSNLSGGSLILSGGLSTGNASGGSIILGVSSPGSAGSSTNDTKDRLVITSDRIISTGSFTARYDLASPTKTIFDIQKSNGTQVMWISSSAGTNPIGTDVFMWVSGSRTTNNTGADKVVFDGDVRISGSLSVGTGSILLTSNDVQFGSNGMRIEKNGNDMKFFDPNNSGGLTLTQLSATGGGTGPIYWTSNAAGEIYTTGSAGIGTSDPISSLHVKSTVENGAANGVLYAVDSSSNPLLWVSGSGYIGIGTSTASAATNLLKSVNGNVVSLHGPSSSNLLFEIGPTAGLSGSIIASDQGMLMIPGTSRTLGLGSDNSVKMVVETDGDVNIQTSNRYFDASIASGQGIRLRSSPGNSDTQVLDCYYEQDLTVSPGDTSGTLDATFDSAYQTLKMTRVGRLVTISGRLVVDYVGTGGAGTTRLFIDLGTAVGDRPSMPTAAAIYLDGFAADFDDPVMGYVDNGTSRLYIDRFVFGVSASGTTTTYLAPYLIVGSEIIVSVTYAVA